MVWLVQYAKPEAAVVRQINSLFPSVEVHVAEYVALQVEFGLEQQGSPVQLHVLEHDQVVPTLHSCVTFLKQAPTIGSVPIARSTPRIVRP